MSTSWDDLPVGQRGTVAIAAALLLASALSGCADDRPALDDLALGGPAPWRTSTVPVDTGGLAWATGETVHLGDGTTIDTGTPLQAFLVGGDGVFFVPLDSEDDGRFRGADLFFAGPDAGGVDTGLDVDDEGVAVSPDGSHLAVLATDYDDGAAEMRLFDLSSGEDVTATDGFDPDPDDPVQDLLESEVSIEGISDEEVYAGTLQGRYAYDLDTGEGRAVGDDETVPGLVLDPLVSRDGDWRIEQTAGLRDVVVGPEGDELVPDAGTPRWTLTSWLGASTVIGVAIAGEGSGDTVGPGNSLALMTCRVPSGTCETVPGTEGERVLLPLRTVPGALVDLRPRDER